MSPRPPEDPLGDPPGEPLRDALGDPIQGPTRPGGSWALQGCLFGSVALFVVMLLFMIFLAYRRFREQTADPAPVAPTPALLFEG